MENRERDRLTGFIPLQIRGFGIEEINRLPIWFVARLERPSIRVKLVREDELVRLPIKPHPAARILWGIPVDQACRCPTHI